MGRLKTYVFPCVTFAAIVILWNLYIKTFDVPDYILPGPRSVLDEVIILFGHGYIWPHLLFTLQSTVVGYLIGCGAGTVLGSLIAESKTFDAFVHPFVVMLQSMPKIALAPLVVVWFGYGLESKIVMVALICFFPIFVNTIVGIRQADSNLIDVFRAFSASRSRIFFHVKMPAAAPHIFAGLQIGVVFALIGAIVAEFVASPKGLGTVLEQAAVELNTALNLAVVFTLAIIGLLANLVVRAIHRRVVFWERNNESRVTNASS